MMFAAGAGKERRPLRRQVIFKSSLPQSTISLDKCFSPINLQPSPQLLECAKLRWQIPTNDLEQAEQELPQSANIHPLIQNISLH